MIRALAAHRGDVSIVTRDMLARDALGASHLLWVLVVVRDAELVGSAALCSRA